MTSNIKVIKGNVVSFFPTMKVKEDKTQYVRVSLKVEVGIDEFVSIRFNQASNGQEEILTLKELVINNGEIQLECEEIKGRYEGKAYTYFKPTKKGIEDLINIYKIKAPYIKRNVEDIANDFLKIMD